MPRDDLINFVCLLLFLFVVGMGVYSTFKASLTGAEARRGEFPESALYVGSIVEHRADGVRFVISAVHNNYCVNISNSSTSLYRVCLAELKPVTEIKQE